MLHAAMPAIRALVAAQRSLAARIRVVKRQDAPLAVDPIAVAVVTSVGRPFIQQILRYEALMLDGCVQVVLGTMLQC